MEGFPVVGAIQTTKFSCFRKLFRLLFKIVKILKYDIALNIFEHSVDFKIQQEKVCR